jgi:periodic tryptophan protein 2
VLTPSSTRTNFVLSGSSNKSLTFAFENRKNISVLALSPDGNVLISVDEDGRALLVNARRGVILHHFNFRKTVKDIKFSPDGRCVLPIHYYRKFYSKEHRYIAATHGAHIQVWRTPNHLVREFAPFVLHRTYTGHHDDVLSIQWSPDSK